MSRRPLDLSRRRIIAAAGLLGGGLAADAAASAPRPDLNDPATATDAWLAIKAGAARRPRLGLFDGSLLALAADGRMRPFLGLRGISLARIETEADGLVFIRQQEAGLYYDLDSGRPITRLRNPFTGREVSVPLVSAVLVAAVGRGVQATDAPAWSVAGEQASLEEAPHPVGVWTHPLDGAEGVDNEHVASRMATHHVQLAALAQPAADRAWSFGGWLQTGPWPSWLRMSEALGAGLQRCRFECGHPTTFDAIQTRLRELGPHPMASAWSL